VLKVPTPPVVDVRAASRCRPQGRLYRVHLGHRRNLPETQSRCKQHQLREVTTMSAASGVRPMKAPIRDVEIYIG